jgi:hypothetical protein
MVKSGTMPWSALYSDPFLSVLIWIGLEMVKIVPLAVVQARTTQLPPPLARPISVTFWWSFR